MIDSARLFCLSGWEGSGKTTALNRLKKRRVPVLPEMAIFPKHLDPKGRFFTRPVTEYALLSYIAATKAITSCGPKVIWSDRGIVDVFAYIVAFEPLRDEFSEFVADFVQSACELLERDWVYDDIALMSPVTEPSAVQRIVSDPSRFFSDDESTYRANAAAWQASYFRVVEEHPSLCRRMTCIGNYLTCDVDAALEEVVAND